MGEWGCVALKSTGIRLSYLYACFVPNQLEQRLMHASAVDDFHFHIVCNDLKLHPLEATTKIEKSNEQFGVNGTTLFIT